MKKQREFDNMLNNWGAYSEIAKKSDELAAREKAYDEEQARKNEEMLAAEAAKEAQQEDL